MGLISPAYAQSPEIVAKTGDALLNQGVLGILCVILLGALVVMGLVARHLYNDLKALNAVTVADRERLILALEKARGADEGVEAALNSVKAALDIRAQAVSDLSHQTEIVARDFRHALNNISQAVEGIARWMRPDRPGGGA